MTKDNENNESGNESRNESGNESRNESRNESGNESGNEIGRQVFRKLSWFHKNKLPIHFCLLDKYGWKNGEIVDLDEKKLTLVLKEFKEGELPFLCEEINISTIKQFKNPNERN